MSFWKGPEGPQLKKQDLTLGGWPGRIVLPQILAGLSDRGLGTGGMGQGSWAWPGYSTLRTVLSSGHQQLALGLSFPQLHFYFSSCHLTSYSYSQVKAGLVSTVPSDSSGLSLTSI